MKIKAFILAVTFATVSLAAFAQKEVATAKTNYEKYQTLKGTAVSKIAMKTAKEAIDKGAANPKLQADASLWTYRAQIYADLSLLDSVETTITPLMNEAVTALGKAVELDKEGLNKAGIDNAKDLIGAAHLNLGVVAFKTKDYNKAYGQFKEGLTYTPKDSVLTLYSALMALYGKNYQGAIEQYKVAIANKQGNPEVYTNLFELYLTEKDTVTAIKYAAEGATMYRDNGLATKEIQYSLMTGKSKEMIDKISSQAAKEPTNKIFPYYLALAYDEGGNTAKAEESYKAAIALDANYPEPYVNLGRLILKNGLDLYNATNKLSSTQKAEYTAGMSKANAEFERAFPYLLKATELNPKSRSAFLNLKTYYNLKQNTAKSAEITKILETLPEE